MPVLELCSVKSGIWRVQISVNTSCRSEGCLYMCVCVSLCLCFVYFCFETISDLEKNYNCSTQNFSYTVWQNAHSRYFSIRVDPCFIVLANSVFRNWSSAAALHWGCPSSFQEHLHTLGLCVCLVILAVFHSFSLLFLRVSCDRWPLIILLSLFRGL